MRFFTVRYFEEDDSDLPDRSGKSCREPALFAGRIVDIFFIVMIDEAGMFPFYFLQYKGRKGKREKL